MPQTLVTRNLQWFLVKSLFSNSLLLTRCELLRQVRRRLPSLYFLKVLLFFLRFYLRRLLISTSILHFLWEIFVVSFLLHFTFCLMILYLCIVSFKHNSFWLLLAPLCRQSTWHFFIFSIDFTKNSNQCCRIVWKESCGHCSAH